MATVLTYNNVELDDIKTIDFSQEPVLTDDKTSHLYDKIRIHVRAYLNERLNPALVDETVEDTYMRIRSCLGAKGKNLTFSSDDTDVVTILAPDCQSGPFPGAISVKAITTETWEVEFEVTTYIAACCNTYNEPNTLLANRWVDCVSIDKDHYSTWTRKGKLSFRYDLLKNLDLAGNVLAAADSLRNNILASCPPKQGFYRTKMEFSPSSDWLTYDYSIEDKECYALPIKLVKNSEQGAAITEWTGTYRAIPISPNLVKAELNIELTGNKAALKSEMYNVASKIAASILSIRRNWKGAGNIFPASGYFEHDLHENKVRLSVKVNQAHAPTTLGGFTVPFFSVSRTGPWTGADNQVPNPGSRGTARLALLSSVIQDNCLNGNVLGPGDGIPTFVPPLNATSIT